MSMSAIVRPIVLVATVLGITAARAQGIPVIDAANLTQAIHQLQAWEQQWFQMHQQLQQQVQQVQLASRQLTASTGSRGLGTVANALRESPIETGFHDALAAAPTHEDAARLVEAQARRISAATTQRFRQIQTLMTQVDAATDVKGAQEITARIGAEQAMLAAEQQELSQLQQAFRARLAALDRAHFEAQRNAIRQPLRPVDRSKH